MMFIAKAERLPKAWKKKEEILYGKQSTMPPSSQRPCLGKVIHLHLSILRDCSVFVCLFLED